MIPTAALLVSIVGVGCMIVIKQWELRRGGVPWRHARARLDARVRNLAVFLHTVLPHMIKRGVQEMGHAFVYHVSATVLLLVRLTERKLLRFVNVVKGKREIRTNGTSSAFLRDVSEHRDDLRRRRNGSTTA